MVLLSSVPVFAQDEVVDLKSGKAMYDAWCARCHGEDGRGLVEDLELEAPAPDFTDCSFNTSEPRSDWKAVVAHGGPARGLSWSMPAWSEAISDEQIDLIIDYTKTFCTDARWPKGELNFRRAQVTAKAFPENEALLVPIYTHTGRQRSSATSLIYESRVGARGQWEISIPFESNYQASTNGIGDIELSYKHALYSHLPSLSIIISAGLEVGMPTGSASKGFGSGTWTLAPFLAAGKGFKNLFLQSSIKYEKTLEGDESEIQYNFAITYQPTDERFGVIPMLELNGVKSLEDGTNSLFFTPQLYVGLVKRGHLALSVGTQIPVAGLKPFDYRIVAFFLWEYTDGGIWW